MKMTDADERAFAVLDAVSADIEQQGGRPDSMNVREHEQIKQAIEHIRARLAADQQKGGGELCAGCGDPVDPNPDENGETRCADCWDMHQRYATPQPSIPAPAQQEVIETLLQLAYRAWCLADDTEDGEHGLAVTRENFDALSAELDKLDALPDDQPGYTMEAAAKARWALRDLLAHPPHADQETQG